LNELALFAGAGGGILGGKLLGWETVCAVELDPYARAVLAARQNDKTLKAFPIWDDVCTFDGRPWRGIVDVVSGGFPCQDISIAGKGKGISGAKSGLWREFARIIREVRPSYVFVENSPMLALRGLGDVLRDLALSGYNARWGVLGAHDVGAPHKRDRIWIVAHSKGLRYWEGRAAGNLFEKNGRPDTKVCTEPGGSSEQSQDLANTKSERCGEKGELRHEQPEEWSSGGSEIEFNGNDSDSGRIGHGLSEAHIFSRWNGFKRCRWWAVEPGMGRAFDGVAQRLDLPRADGKE